MNIYVGNLNFKVEEDDLRGVFEDYGSVSDVRIIKDRDSGRSKGFGFVTMDNNEEAEKAVEELNGSALEGRDMVVNEARERNSNDRRRY
jgi:RNA recognition motif-containing protein